MTQQAHPVPEVFLCHVSSVFDLGKNHGRDLERCKLEDGKYRSICVGLALCKRQAQQRDRLVIVFKKMSNVSCAAAPHGLMESCETGDSAKQWFVIMRMLYQNLVEEMIGVMLEEVVMKAQVRLMVLEIKAQAFAQRCLGLHRP